MFDSKVQAEIFLRVYTFPSVVYHTLEVVYLDTNRII